MNACSISGARARPAPPRPSDFYEFRVPTTRRGRIAPNAAPRVVDHRCRSRDQACTDCSFKFCFAYSTGGRCGNKTAIVRNAIRSQDKLSIFERLRLTPEHQGLTPEEPATKELTWKLIRLLSLNCVLRFGMQSAVTAKRFEERLAFRQRRRPAEILGSVLTPRSRVCVNLIRQISAFARHYLISLARSVFRDAARIAPTPPRIAPRPSPRTPSPARATS